MRILIALIGFVSSTLFLPVHVAAISATSIGGVSVETDSPFFIGAAATGSTCVYADAAGVVAGAGAHVTAAGAVAPAGCTVRTVAAGLGILLLPKFPAPFGTGEAAISTRGITAGGVTSNAKADWSSGEAAVLGIVARDSTLNVRASVVGKPGLALAESKDPWIFTPTQSGDLHVTVTLEGANLQTAIDQLGEGAFADFSTVGAFGLGSTPGVNTFAEWTFEASISGNDSFAAPSALLLDQTFTLEAGQAYWLTADVSARAETVTEPATLAWLGSGLAGVAVAACRRKTRA